MQGCRGMADARLTHPKNPRTEHSMKKLLLLSTLALACVPVLAAGPQPTLKFTTLPMAESAGGGHKLFPYRNEDKLAVIVVDPIACGRKPVNPRYEIKDTHVTLQYDLTKAPDSAGGTCTAVSTFEIDPVPHQELVVSFAGGSEPFVVASMVRCPNSTPKIDVWDCMVPHK